MGMHKEHAFLCSIYLSPPPTHAHKPNSISNLKVDNPRARGKRRGFTQPPRATRSQPESIRRGISPTTHFLGKKPGWAGSSGFRVGSGSTRFCGLKTCFWRVQRVPMGPTSRFEKFFWKKIPVEKGETPKKNPIVFFRHWTYFAGKWNFFSQLTIIFFGELRDVCFFSLPPACFFHALLFSPALNMYKRHMYLAVSSHVLQWCLLCCSICTCKRCCSKRHMYLAVSSHVLQWCLLCCSICTCKRCCSKRHTYLAVSSPSSCHTHTHSSSHTHTTFFIPLFVCLFSYLPPWRCTFDMHHSLHLPLSRTHTHSHSHHFICSIYFDRIASNQEFCILYIRQSNKRIIPYIHVDKIMMNRYVYIDR